MISPAHRRLFACVLMSAAGLVSGCERVRSLAGKFKHGGTGTSAVTGTYSSEQVSVLDDATYAAFVAQKGKLIVVDFYADWCGPCRTLGPMLEQAAAAHPGVVYVGRVNVDRVPKLAAANQVRGIPDVHIYKEGREVDHFVGCPGEAELTAKIATLADGITAAAATAEPAKPAEPSEPAKPIEESIRRMPKGWMPPGIRKQ